VSVHPEFETEQAYITHAYACLERMRVSARQLQYSIEPDSGGTHQARLERDVVEEKALGRLARLQLGSESLVFGRIDRKGSAGPDSGERFYIGRLPISDREQNPIVIDWRAPVAEAFYRATGRNPLGLERRRHFATEESRLIGIDDEVFDVERLEASESGLVGTGALLAALGRARSGLMRDIVATIQAEQDEIIRAELPGVLVVQGGPGTGKTAVALHRASYLLYTHRFPLERQGVLVVGPNRLFIRYISRVLPALGETGVDLAGVDDLVHDVTVSAREPHEVALIKGDLRMTKVIRRAVATRQRGLRDGLTIGFGLLNLTVTAAETAEMVVVVKRGHRVHNASRKHLQSLLVERLYQRYREAMARSGFTIVGEGVRPFEDVADQLKRTDEVKLALDRMWPLLTPAMLLRDLYGATALIRAATRDVLNEQQQRLLVRARGESVEDVQWTSADVPLLDEAAQLLGAIPKLPTHAGSHHDGPHLTHGSLHDEGMRTYGHIVVDEAQDLSPMQLRMVSRRSLGGSMTIVGDIGQATGMWAPADWDQVLSYLPHKRAPRKVELTVGYRTPSEIMTVAARVLAVAAPNLVVPSSVRSVGHGPVAYRSFDRAASVVPAAVEAMRTRIGRGTIGVLCPDSLLEEVAATLTAAGIVQQSIGEDGDAVTILPVRTSKGLEFDGVVVVEPAEVVDESAQGLRALFVALTRPTQALAVVHFRDLPPTLDGAFGEPTETTETTETTEDAMSVSV
jgi:DNA helicase IV